MAAVGLISCCVDVNQLDLAPLHAGLLTGLVYTIALTAGIAASLTTCNNRSAHGGRRRSISRPESTLSVLLYSSSSVLESDKASRMMPLKFRFAILSIKTKNKLGLGDSADARHRKTLDVRRSHVAVRRNRTRGRYVTSSRR